MHPSLHCRYSRFIHKERRVNKENQNLARERERERAKVYRDSGIVILITLFGTKNQDSLQSPVHMEGEVSSSTKDSSRLLQCDAASFEHGEGKVSTSQSPLDLSPRCPDMEDRLTNVKNESVDSKSSSLSAIPKILPCKICILPSTGIHYGVRTCDACKTFYKRYSVVRDDLRPGCDRKPSGDCARRLTGSARFTCVDCRYKRCIDQGMSKSAVKKGRYTLEMKNNDEKARRTLSDRAGADGDMDGMDEPPLSLPPCLKLSSYYQTQSAIITYETLVDIFERTTIKHFSKYFFLLDPQYNPEVSKAREFLLNEIGLDKDCIQTVMFREGNATSSQPIIDEDATRSEEILLASPLFNQLDEDVVSITRMAKALPGFSPLDLDEKLVFVKHAVPEILILTEAFMTDYDMKMSFRIFMKEDAFIMYPTVHTCRLYHFNPQFHPQFLTFVKRFWDLKLTVAEIGSLVSVLLFTPDRPNFVKSNHLEDMYQQYVEILKYSLKTNHPDNTQIFTETLSLLSQLRELCKRFLIPTLLRHQKPPNTLLGPILGACLASDSP